MAKARIQFVCQSCGAVHPRWEGRCDSCGEWNTIVEETPSTGVASGPGRPLKKGRVVKLEPLDGDTKEQPRIVTQVPEFDRVAGGGFVRGSALLVGGDPGIGKSTLLMQISASLAKAGHGVVYVSGEEAVAQEITEITTGLKALTKELNVPIIALSQLSRQVENRDDKRPQLSDLRESGSIEQDADVVLFVYRDEYYLQNKEPEFGTTAHEEWKTKLESARGKADVIIAKQRHGPTGTAGLAFQAEYTRFTDLMDDEHIPERYD